MISEHGQKLHAELTQWGLAEAVRLGMMQKKNDEYYACTPRFVLLWATNALTYDIVDALAKTITQIGKGLNHSQQATLMCVISEHVADTPIGMYMKTKIPQGVTTDEHLQRAHEETFG